MTIVTDIDRKPFEAAMAGIYAKAQTRPRGRGADRTNSQGEVNWARNRASRTKLRAGRRASLRAAASRLVGLVRAVPIRWRILSIAALNSAVVVVLAALIWNGAQVLGSAWDDVRQVRESDKILALLESETGRLQNLIHRYINQPSPGAVRRDPAACARRCSARSPRAPRPTRCCRDRWSSSNSVTERFLNGFGELRTVQATITKTYEDQVLAPRGTWPGFIRSSRARPGHRDALIWPSLGKSREAFTAMLVAANAYYLSLASASAEDARRNTETIEKTIPVMATSPTTICSAWRCSG